MNDFGLEFQRALRVGLHAYSDLILKRSFFLITFGLPTFLVMVGFGTAILVVLLLGTVVQPVGPLPVAVVDLTARFDDPSQRAIANSPLSIFEGGVQMRPYDSERAAAQALAAGEVQAYFVIQANYFETGIVRLHYDTQISPLIPEVFGEWINDQLKRDMPPDLLARYEAGPNIMRQDSDGQPAFSRADISNWIMVLVIVYFARIGSFVVSGFMYDSIAKEARDRTIEILLSGMSRLAFILGKFFGLAFAGMTQLAIWALLFGGAAWVVFQGLEIDLFGQLIEWPYFGLAIAMLSVSFLLDLTFGAAAGILRTSGGAGPQLLNAINVIINFTLLYSIYFLPFAPDSPLAVGASLFPITAPIVMLVRLVVSQVPAWQIWVAQGLLWFSLIGMLVALSRLLNANFVSYAPAFGLITWLKGLFKREAKPA